MNQQVEEEDIEWEFSDSKFRNGMSYLQNNITNRKPIDISFIDEVKDNLDEEEGQDDDEYEDEYGDEYEDEYADEYEDEDEENEDEDEEQEDEDEDEEQEDEDDETEETSFEEETSDDEEENPFLSCSKETRLIQCLVKNQKRINDLEADDIKSKASAWKKHAAISFKLFKY